MNTAIVLAAGNGSRMKSDIPKQYINIDDRPIIYYSLKVMEESKYIDEVILVTRAEDIDYCRNEIISKYNFSKVKEIIAGGSERYYSVYNGLKYASKSDYVWIHDGARPCIDEDILAGLYDASQKYGTAVAGVVTKDTVKIVDEEQMVSTTPQRAKVWIVQTPQVFETKELIKAYDKMLESSSICNITDDAMVMESFGTLKVRMVEANYLNIKVTTPEDIFLVEKYLKKIKK